MKLIDKIYSAGIVGCGGAGFPTHVKLNAKVDYFLVNAVECEPLLKTDRWIMMNFADEVIQAIMAVMARLEAKTCRIAIKEEYREEIKALESAIQRNGADIRIHSMESFYPAGDEQVIVYEATGRVVPEAGIPLDVGCVVSNVTTLKHVYDAMEDCPFTHKYLTVTGNVRNPSIIKVPVGTSFKQCIDLVGGSLTGEYSAISGGPMMGAYLKGEELENSYVAKTTSGIIVLENEDFLSGRSRIRVDTMRRLASSACIQCNFCSQLCPRNLLGHSLYPHKIMRKLAMNPSLESILDYDDVKYAALCSECGVCEHYACPMGLQPRSINGEIKKLLAARGERFSSNRLEYSVDSFREYRRIPTRRLVSRLDIGKYYSRKIGECIDFEADTVSISLSQHIGAPAKPVVAVGDDVKAGQIIAVCQEGKLGALVHASIDGIVRQVNGRILISKG